MAVVINGTTGITNPNGSAGAPAFTGQGSNTGLYFPTNTSAGIATAGLGRIIADANGYITKPYQPMAFVRGGSGVVTVAAGLVQIVLGSADINVSSSFNTSTYTFTAPVAGYYLVTGVITWNSSVTTNYSGILFYKNGSNFINTYTNHPSGIYAQSVSTILVSLSAGDTISMYTDNSTANNAYEKDRTWIGIVLLN